jgi:hypothetical protein
MGMSQAIPARVLDLEALAAEVADFLDEAPVAETMAAKLSRVLHGFLKATSCRRPSVQPTSALTRRRCWRSSPSSDDSTPTR